MVCNCKKDCSSLDEIGSLQGQIRNSTFFVHCHLNISTSFFFLNFYSVIKYIFPSVCILYLVFLFCKILQTCFTNPSIHLCLLYLFYLRARTLAAISNRILKLPLLLIKPDRLGILFVYSLLFLFYKFVSHIVIIYKNC